MSKNLTKKNKEAIDKAIKELEKKKEPVFIEKLELGEGETFVGNLTDAEKYQLLIRHINVLEQLLQRIDLNSNVSAICLMELCKDRSIDINAILNGKEK